MKSTGAPDASVRPAMARRVSRGASIPGASIPGASLPAATRRVLAGLGVAAVALVAAVGAFTRQAAGHVAPLPSASDTAAAGALSQNWGASGSGQIDLFDLAWKGLLVLALLFVTLRVLARVQGVNGTKRGNLNVLESRTLASKASLHLVAVGDRRLVVGLTPSGMVALAELDADELPDAEPVASPGAGATATTATATTAASTFAAGAKAFVAPIDSFAARLAATLHREQTK